jgi:hypothetical protein
MLDVRAPRTPALALTAAMFAGCGGEPADALPREAVSGRVTFEGKPLAAGLIQFQPAGQEATAGTAPVADGRYAIRKDGGLVPGKYRVAITTPVAEAGPAPALPGDEKPPPREPIPARYNAKSTLAADVAKGGPNTFDFDLKEK